jgi:xanthine/uracil/vitamin C permease (AzgA family)
MMQNVAKIDWKDYTESIPAFLIVVGIPFVFNCRRPGAWIHQLRGRERIQRSRSRNSWLTYVLAIVLVVYFVFVRSRMG